MLSTMSSNSFLSDFCIFDSITLLAKGLLIEVPLHDRVNPCVFIEAEFITLVSIKHFCF